MLHPDETNPARTAASVASGDFSPVSERILAQADRRPGENAITDNRGVLTFGALAAWIETGATQIAALPGTAPVAILLPNGAGFVAAVLAAQKARRTYVLLDIEFPEQRARQIIAHAGVTALIVEAETEALAKRIAPDLPRIVMTTRDACVTAGAITPLGPADPARIVSITYTSGSTGAPKGVLRSEQSLLSRVQYFNRESGLVPDDRVPILLPLAIGSTLQRTLAALAAGAQICIIDLRRIGAGAAIRMLEEFSPTVFFMVPSLFRTLFGPDDAALPALTRDVRWIRLSADRVLRSDVDLYRRRFPPASRLWVSIGSNETQTYASWRIDHETPLDRALVPVGYPRPGIELTIIGEDGMPVAPGEIGEIVIASESLAEGYWNNNTLNQARFSQTGAGTRRYRTGDFGRLLPDGLLEFVGRRDRQVKVRGNTIHLSEIEAALDTCREIAEAAVVARQGEGAIQLVVYCAGDATADLPSLVRTTIRRRLPAPMWPSDVMVLDALPRMASGKIDLDELQRRDLQRAAPRTAPPSVAALSPLAAIARACWDDILGAGAFDSAASFEDAGGHSLAAMEILLLLERRLGRGVPPNLFGPQVRPADLLQQLASLDDAANAAGTHDAVPDIFLFPQLFGIGFDLNDFVRRLGEHFRVHVMDYADADGQTISTIDPDAYFEAVARKVLAAGPPRRLWIAGYVFGCRVAAETARRLQARGIAVEFVGLIAGLTAKAQAGRSGRRGRPPRAALGRRLSRTGLSDYIAGRVTVRLAPLLQRWGAAGLARVIVSALAKTGLNQAAVDTMLMARKHTAQTAFAAMPLGPLPLPVTVFTTSGETSESRHNSDLGWSEFCNEVDIVSIPGSRRDTLAGVGADAILAALTDIETRLRPAPETTA